MDFEHYWTLIGGDVNFADRKMAAQRAWSLCAPGRNPYFFILDFQTKRRETLTFAEYYAKFGTTEEQGGWKMENPTGQQVIYVKAG